MNSAPLRLFLVAIAGVLFLAGCSSEDDTTSSTIGTAIATEEPTEDATATTVTPTTVDDRTDEEIAIDWLDALMFSLGVEDLATTSDCVVERLESEGIELEGDGTAELVGIFGCDETALARFLPPTNEALSPEARSCTVEGIGDWINALTIPEAEAFFETDEPPAEFIESTATRCDVSEGELRAAF